MDEQAGSTEQFEAEPRPPAGRRLPDARLADRGRRRRPGGLAPAQPRRHQRCREPRRLADDRASPGCASTCCARAPRGGRNRSDATCPIRSQQRPSADPEHEALLADSVGLALLVVLDTLAPAERLAFVLHDMFAVPFDEIAAHRGRSPAAARQLASRARRRVQGAARGAGRGPELASASVVDAFLARARR